MSHKEITSRASLEPGANPGFSEIVREVSTMTLDSFDFRPIAVIKIDVEGHEGSVLDGAARTIAQERPVLVVEIEERHHPGLSAQIFERILRKDYACFFLDAGRLKQFTSETIMQLQPVGAVPSIGRRMRGYVNNFIFVPAEKQSTITKTLRNRLRAQRWLFMQPSF
jgi:hypothetical protein